MASTGKNGESSTDLDHLKEDLANLQKDLKGLADSLLNQGKDKAREAKEAVTDTYEHSMDSVQQFIKDKPVTSLGIAFGIGALLSLLFCRK